MEASETVSPVVIYTEHSAGLNPVDALENPGAPRKLSPNTELCVDPSARAYTNCFIESSV